MTVILQSSLPADSPAGCPLIGWHNLVNPANVAATTANASFPISNVANPATHLKWIGTANTVDEYITVSNLSSTVSYVAIAKHNLGTVGVPVSVEVLTSNSPPNWAAVTTPTIPPDNSPIIFRFTPQTVLGVRVKIEVSTTSPLPEAAVVYAGQLLVLERSITLNGHTPITYGRRANIVNGMSETGNFLGRIMLGEYRESKAEFAWFTPTFYRPEVDNFLNAAQEVPFFWAWDPTNYPAETGYCWLTNDAKPEVDPVTQRVALTLEMRGIA